MDFSPYQRLVHATINSAQWSHWPWRALRSPLENAKVHPTFVACEWSYFAFAAACAWHARRNKQATLLASSWICGTINDTIFMALPLLSADNFWQAGNNASINLTPRMPLYIPAVYNVFLYASAVAAQRTGLGRVPEAALAGLLAHFLYGPYDVNGTRQVWWTWHDSDPAIRERFLNAPLASSVWLITFSAAHAFLARWVQETFPHLSLLAKVGVVGTLCTPLFVSVMSVPQILVRDELGIVSRKTYAFTLAAFALAVQWGRAAAGGATTRPAAAPNAVSSDRVLMAMLTMHYAVQWGVAAFGQPTKCVVTGSHQRVGRPGDEPAKDLMGHEREDTVEAPPQGGTPALYSKHDYAFVAREEDGRLDASGSVIVAPDPDDPVKRDWYSIRGVDRPPELGGRAAEVAGVSAFAALGLGAYRWAWGI